MSFSYVESNQIEDKNSTIWNHDINSLKDSIAVLDVREQDEFYDGHIKGAQNHPSGRWTDNKYVSDLLHECIEKKVSTVVVHCFKSQVRGPTCARVLSSALDELAKGGEDLNNFPEM